MRSNNFCTTPVEGIMNISVEQSAMKSTRESRAARISAVPVVCVLAWAPLFIAACSDAPGTAVTVAQADQQSGYVEPVKFPAEAGIVADRRAADATRPVTYAGQPAAPVSAGARDATVPEGGTILVSSRELGTASDGGYFAYPGR